MTKTLQLAKKLKGHSNFRTASIPNKGAKLIASEIGARIVTLDPYSENYIEAMLAIAHSFLRDR